MIRNGRGLTLPGYNFTGSGSFDAPQNFDANREQYEAGSTAGMAGSGSFAIRLMCLIKIACVDLKHTLLSLVYRLIHSSFSFHRCWWQTPKYSNRYPLADTTYVWQFTWR